MKKFLILVVLLLLVACTQQPQKADTPSNDVVESQIQDTGAKDESQDADIQDAKTSSGIKEFSIKAKISEFMPNEILVSEGDEVRLTLEAIEGTHGFVIPEFNVNAKLETGKPVAVTFVADKKGTYSFFCNIPCGEGHKGMRGTLIVE